MKIWEVELQSRDRILHDEVFTKETVVANDYRQAATKVLKHWNEDGMKPKLFVSSVRKVAETTVGD